jgi:GGDEF domain-containing protein
LLRQSQLDALTDSLTGLPNRRALTQDLGAGAGLRAGEVTLGLFDLDGFKTYNDTFGHAAGDALLARLGAKLAAATTGAGKAYRMGGAVCGVRAGGGGGPALAAAAATLSESGEGWKVGASFGIVSIPGEARDTDDALQVADRRMYADKAARRG